MKYVYNYHRITREFLNKKEAALDPEESKLNRLPNQTIMEAENNDTDVYLLPAHATFIEPPVVQENKIPVFNTDTKKWMIRTDLRGTKYYDRDGTEFIIIKIGKRVPVDCTIDSPPSEFQKPLWNDSEWLEDALLYYGRHITSKEQVDEIVARKITNLGEEKVKTLKLIAWDGPCPEWDAFLAARQILLDEANQFITDNNLV